MPTPMLRRPVQLQLPITAPRNAPGERRPDRPGDRPCPACGGPMSCVGRACACVVCGYGARYVGRKRPRRRLRRRR